jgi:hypothetical protein
VRPALSAWLHAPEILLGGGAYTYWLSRWFVCLQLGAIAWAWVRTAEQLQKRPLPLPERLGLAVLALILSLHTFPLMAWPSIDAMFLASLGIWAVASRLPRLMWVGYAALGASALCRQNFGLVPLVVLVLFGDWRQLRYVVAAGAASDHRRHGDQALFDMLIRSPPPGARERGLTSHPQPLVPWGVSAASTARELLSADSRAVRPGGGRPVAHRRRGRRAGHDAPHDGALRPAGLRPWRQLSSSPSSWGGALDVAAPPANRRAAAPRALVL